VTPRLRAAWASIRAELPDLAVALAASLAVAVAVSWPLALHLFPYDGWLVSSPRSLGSEFLGVLGSNQTAMQCFALHGAEPLDAWVRPWRAFSAMIACNFPTHLWNTVDIAWFHWPLGHLFGWGTGWNLSTLLYVWGNALGAWALARSLGSARVGALGAAVVFAACAPSWMAIAQGRTMNGALGTVPLVLAAVVAVVRGRHPVALALAAGGALALSLYWFWFHALYLTLLTPGLLALVPDLRARPRRLAALLLAAGVALVLLGPSFSAFGTFAEGGGVARHAPALGGPLGGVPAPGSPELTEDQRILLMDSLPAFSPLYPEAWWNPFHRVNPAWIAPAWALLALGALADARRHLGWLAAALVAVVLSWGPWPIVDLHQAPGPGVGGPWASPLYQLAYAHVPLFPAFRHPDRFLVVAVIAVSVGVAATLTRLCASDRPAALRVAGPLLAAGAFAWGVWQQAASPVWPAPGGHFEIPTGLVDRLRAAEGAVLTLPVPDPDRAQGPGLDVGAGYDTRVAAFGALHGRPVVDRAAFHLDRGLLAALLRLPEGGASALPWDVAETRGRLRALGVRTIVVDGFPFGQDRQGFEALLEVADTLFGAPVAREDGLDAFLGDPGAAAPTLVVYELPAAEAP